MARYLLGTAIRVLGSHARFSSLPSQLSPAWCAVLWTGEASRGAFALPEALLLGFLTSFPPSPLANLGLRVAPQAPPVRAG